MLVILVRRLLGRWNRVASVILLRVRDLWCHGRLRLVLRRRTAYRGRSCVRLRCEGLWLGVWRRLRGLRMHLGTLRLRVVVVHGRLLVVRSWIGCNRNIA